MKYGVQMIDIKKLHSHPKNPRKSVGDVSELSESIKKNGIMQNLTVVPFISEVTGKVCDGEYIIVIGHRRRAAAEAAGLSELPCIIKEMTESEQLATMLAENIQRSDLSPIEQAEGIQMMLDIGETVAEIGEKTGFSESTVRRRMKLLELDREKLRKTEGRGATLADYEKLNEIKDVKERNKVLESIGTNNFDMNITQALDKQKRDENKKRLISELEKFATESDKRPGTGYAYVSYYSLNSGDAIVKAPKEHQDGEYVYTVSLSYIELFRKTSKKSHIEESEEEVAERITREEAETREKERKEKLSELSRQSYELRKTFIEEFSPAPRHGKEIKRFLWNMACFEGAGIYQSLIDGLCKTTIDDGGNYEEISSEVDGYFEEHPEKTVLVVAYCLSGDDEFEKYVDYNGQWRENEMLDKLYECLECLGYQMSDDEKALQNGTHKLLKKEV